MRLLTPDPFFRPRIEADKIGSTRTVDVADYSYQTCAFSVEPIGHPMTVAPLLAASPLALAAASSVARQLPGQAAAFARVLASVVTGPATGDPFGTAAAQPLGSLVTIGSDLVEGLRNVAVDQPAQLMRLLRRRLTEVVQEVGTGDATPSVRVRITADRGIQVAGDPPDAVAIERALAADPELTRLVDRLPRAWLDTSLQMTLGDPIRSAKE